MSGHRQADGARADRGRGVTPRAVGLALGLLALICPLNYEIEIYRGVNWSGTWSFASGLPAAVPVIALFLITLVLRLPRLRNLAFTRAELLTIYAMVLVASPVMSHAVMAWLLVKNVGYYYTAQAQPYWIDAFVKHLPTWWAPGDAASVTGFFEGHAPVPWAAWRVPLLAWGGFLTALFICCTCLMSILQRQWITHERLTFPVATVPLEMVTMEGRGASAPGRLTTAVLFWIGLGASFALTFLSTSADKIPALPKVPLFLYEVIPWQPTGPMAALGAVTLVFWPWMLALAYLSPTDLSFSFWFFTIVRHVLTAIAIVAGATPIQPQDWWSSSFPAPYYQGAGAVLALAVWVMWIGRRHLLHVARAALGLARRGSDREEPLPYRGAVLGLLLSVSALVYFLWLSECRVFFGLGVIALTLGYFTIWARLRAETGIGFLAFPIQIQDLVVAPLGSRALRINELIALVTLRAIYTPGFSVSSEVFPGTVLEAFRIAGAAGIDRRRLAFALLAGFLLTLLLGGFLFLRGVYHVGWFGLAVSNGGWLGPQSLSDGGRIVSWVSDESARRPDLGVISATGAGAAVCLFLGAMRLRLWWWPFHPVGYIAANTWGSHWYALPFFIGWLVKTLVVRYGGLRLYRRSLPLATGFIVGDLLNGGVWALLRVVSQGRI